MFFTRNAYEDGDYQKNEEGVSQLKIYQAKFVNDEWQDIKPLPFSSKDYATANPSLGPDNNYLYFSSNMPGGFGNSDIYRVKINDDSSFGEPENLGEKINTEGRENFPFVDNEGRLFFSSDGHLGFGDDFSFTYIANKKTGYVASNRGENPSNDNIYQLDLIEPLDETMLDILVTDVETNSPIEKAEVAIYDNQQNMIKKSSTQEDGHTQHKVISEMKYDIQVNAIDYESNSKNISAKGESMNITIPLEPVVEIIDTITIDNKIFFAFDKAKIKEEAAFELDKIVKILDENPELSIKITSHTDKRGPESYNMRLSQRRAENTLKYFIEAGIDETRLKSEGKGESELKVKCGSNCTNEDHLKNRRSEFTVLR
jgi:outer membrane protein OmpA-like peptidoglycan-associated protein